MSSTDRSGDEEFEAIVARLREEGWPVQPGEDASDDPDGKGPAAADRPSGDKPPAEEPPVPDPVENLPSQWRVPTGDSLSILDEREFVPDEPSPLPSGDLGFWGAAAGLGGGIGWLLYLFFFDRYARPLWWVLAVAITLTGLAMVFLRQPHDRDDDWDDDVDGAVL